MVHEIDDNLDDICSLVRQCVELGANIIKCDPCKDIKDFHKIVKIAGTSFT